MRSLIFQEAKQQRSGYPPAGGPAVEAKVESRQVVGEVKIRIRKYAKTITSY